MIEIFDVTQGTPEWLNCRLGLPTTSKFGTLMASGRNGAASKSRHSYLLTLAAEIITGAPGEEFSTPAMERGKVMEAEARGLYDFLSPNPVEQIGFIKNGQKGCSPDGFVGADGMLEIKTKRGDILIETILQGDFPSEHYWQCMGALWVCEREWIDLACYWPGLPLYVKRLHREKIEIERLAVAVDQFNADLSRIVEQVRNYGQSPREVLREQLRASL